MSENKKGTFKKTYDKDLGFGWEIYLNRDESRAQINPNTIIDATTTIAGVTLQPEPGLQATFEYNQTRKTNWSGSFVGSRSTEKTMTLRCQYSL